MQHYPSRTHQHFLQFSNDLDLLFDRKGTLYIVVHPWKVILAVYESEVYFPWQTMHSTRWQMSLFTCELDVYIML